MSGCSSYVEWSNSVQDNDVGHFSVKALGQCCASAVAFRLGALVSGVAGSTNAVHAADISCSCGQGSTFTVAVGGGAFNITINGIVYRLAFVTATNQPVLARTTAAGVTVFKPQTYVNRILPYLEANLKCPCKPRLRTAA